jgi:hypothetical protein
MTPDEIAAVGTLTADLNKFTAIARRIRADMASFTTSALCLR